MGSHHRTVTTSSPEAQRYFDHGLIWTYSFNHDEAIRCYRAAADLDPTLAMAWWGIALCNGPHINNPLMDEAHSKAAWEALGEARSRRAGAAPIEQELIDALGARYSWPAPKDRGSLDRAYADAVREVYRRHPKDADIAVLFAEALMDLRPWDLWAKDGSPRPETPEVLGALERALDLDPRHPGACHLYIHALEASPKAGRAVAAADRLRTLVPGSGHMVHMPAHIDIRVGNWALAAKQNQDAIEADRKYRRIAPEPGFYRLYMLHNHHFLGFACMMEGRSAEALAAMTEMISGIPDSAIRDSAAMVDPFLTSDLEVMKRFGWWDRIVAHPGPRGGLRISTAMWRFYRALALSALGRLDEARKEQARFAQAKDAVPKDALISINPASHTLSIADQLLNGEIAFRQKRRDEAVTYLRQAVALEDSLRYMEPPDWLTPARHTLGAVLLDSGRVEEAMQVYREDLKIWPENAWSLFGLARCLGIKGSPEATAAQTRFDRAWGRADLRITCTCMCIEPGR
jgi:tetratricopeptide (TPR) repeat protein